MNLTNNLIIAMPGLADPMFEKSVSFICQHTEQGAMGLTINHPTNITFSELLAQLDIPLTVEHLASIPVYLGGPVETGHGFILHSNDPDMEPWTQTLKINDNISLSSSRDILIAIASGKGPSKFLITLGYAGWAQGQIEKEIEENSWLNVTADNDIIFNTPTNKRWESAAMKLGIDINLISGDIGHA
ncbi:MAG: YqgE/AlgH family protein [Gammaproteobacteria bacterium]|nr:YqgE/AlgH family protein [Gammaproteobacteria bacterium]